MKATRSKDRAPVRLTIHTRGLGGGGEEGVCRLSMSGVFALALSDILLRILLKLGLAHGTACEIGVAVQFDCHVCLIPIHRFVTGYAAVHSPLQSLSARFGGVHGLPVSSVGESSVNSPSSPERILIALSMSLMKMTPSPFAPVRARPRSVSTMQWASLSRHTISSL